jgi:ubiquinone/menaquinone biosynthesis C-methylase UbiE
MLPIGTDQNYLLNEQYKSSTNLEARIALHRRFSINTYDWHRWVLDHVKLPQQARVIEIGCGPGQLWAQNADRIPAEWDITLSDFSPGMVAQAQQNLREVAGNFRFTQCDVQSIPLDDASFDAVIANHMLYHVPNRAKAFSEIRRILKPGGRFYAATNGLKHMQELNALIERFLDAPIDPAAQWSAAHFNLESGAEELGRFFVDVTLHRYEDGLIVTEAEPLVAYITSGSKLQPEQHAALSAFIERELVANGSMSITKETGLFEAIGTCRNGGNL